MNSHMMQFIIAYLIFKLPVLQQGCTNVIGDFLHEEKTRFQHEEKIQYSRENPIPPGKDLVPSGKNSVAPACHQEKIGTEGKIRLQVAERARVGWSGH